MSEQKNKGLMLGLEYEVTVEKDGKVISTCKGKAHTWVRNWLLMLRQMMFQATSGEASSVSLNDTGGTPRTWFGGFSSAFAPICAKAPSANNTYGIQVGTSDTAWDRTQYSLQGLITTGTGAGQLVYGAVTVEAYSETDGTVKFRMIRAFTNSSGSTITVKEIGIALLHSGAALNWNFLQVRDVLASPQAVPDGATLTVRYTEYVSYV